MTDLPFELQKFATFLDAQPASLQTAFVYCLCSMMVEAGKMQLVETLPDNGGTICTFETIAGDVFSIAKPAINQEQEAALIKLLEIKLDEEKISL
jgi:hypothetical protein